MSKSTQQQQTSAPQQSASKAARQTLNQPASSGEERMVALQRSAGNQAVNSLVGLSRMKRSADGREVTGSTEFEVPRPPVRSAPANPLKNRERKEQADGPSRRTLDAERSPKLAGSVDPLQKDVEGGKNKGPGGALVPEQDVTGGAAGSGAGNAAPAQATPAQATPKKAGVDTFTVKWKKNANASATNAKLRLDYFAKFKKDAAHDPALADFRQSVMTKWEFKDGPHKGQKGDTSPMHDDNYSRSDDVAGNSLTDTEFDSNDNPGFGSIDATDDLAYEFTAEQTIIDTSQSNKVIAKRGPHKGTVTGADPRTFGGVPTTLS